MHPEIIRNEPGQCPICKMELVQIVDSGSASTDSSLELLLKPTNEFFIGEIKTTSLVEMKYEKNIEADGIITYDTRESGSVAARISGRVDKLYVKSEFQPVVKGQKLFDIYSNELIVDQENLIFLMKNDSANKSLLDATEKKLLIRGLTKSQIEKIKISKVPIQTITVYSPYTGHLHSLSSESLSPKNGDNPEMEEKNPMVGQVIQEGSYVKKGQTIFNIFSIKNVWAVIQFPTETIGLIEPGTPVIIHMDEPGHNEIRAKINFIEPKLNGLQKTTSARIYLENSDQKLKIGMLIKAEIDLKSKSGNFIPSTAVVHLGKNDVVFVQSGKIFRSRIIETGATSGSFIEVISGLSAEEKIAGNGQMLIDSESFIKVNYAN